MDDCLLPGSRSALESLEGDEFDLAGEEGADPLPAEEMVEYGLMFWLGER